MTFIYTVFSLLIIINNENQVFWNFYDVLMTIFNIVKIFIKFFQIKNRPFFTENDFFENGFVFK